MKLSHEDLIGQKALSKSAQAPHGAAKNMLLKYALPGAFALSALFVESRALAQAPNPEQGRAPPVTSSAPVAQPTPAPAVPQQSAGSPGFTTEGNVASVADSNGSRGVYIVSSQRGFAPAVTVEGPCRLRVRFYPAVLAERFTTPQTEYPRQVDYSLGPQGGTATPGRFTGVTRQSQYSSTEIGGGLVIGTPIESMIDIPSGRNVLTVSSPNGLLEVVGIERTPAPVQRTAQPAVTAPAQPRQAEPAEPSEESLRPAFTFEGSYAPLHGLGAHENRGDIISAQPLGHIRLSDRFSLVVGVDFASYGLSLDTAQAQTSLRGYSGSGAAGVSFQSGRHYAYALGLAGYRGITTNVLSLSDGRTLDNLDSGFEYGGQAGYSYSHYFSAMVRGGSSPFNPLSARVMGAVPYTWAEGVYPFVDVHFLWLHSLRPIESAGFVGPTALDENAFHLRALAGLPIYRWGPVAPLIVGGADFNFVSGGITSKAGIVGAGLRTFFTRGLEIEALGGVSLHGSPVGASPLVLLNVGYRM